MPQNQYPAFQMSGNVGPLSVDEVATLLPIDETTGQNGMWCLPNRMYGQSTLLATASTYYITRFVARRRMNVVNVGFVVTTFSATNDNVDVGIFSAAGSKLASSGATAGKVNTANGVKTVALTTGLQLIPGTVYYAGLAMGASAAPATLQSITVTNANAPTMFGSSAGTLEIATAAGATLPASASFATPAAAVIALAVLES